MHPVTPDPRLESPESALLACLAALGTALEPGSHPTICLEKISAALQPQVPHEHAALAYFSPDRRTFTVFAEHGEQRVVPTAHGDTAEPRHVVRTPVNEALFGPVFRGEAVCVPDMSTDARFHAYRDWLRGLRSAIIAPLVAGTRVIGYVVTVGRKGAAFDAIHVDRMRALGRLLGPFIELIVALHGERRRRHRIETLAPITRLLGTSLDVREIMTTLGELIRPAMDFDAMGVVLWTPGSPDFVLFSVLGEPPDPAVYSLTTRDYSVADAVTGGRSVLIADASTELDQAYAGDRATLAAGLRSCIWAPLRFGDEIGGALFLGKRQPYWYDDVDVEVAAVIAARIVLGIQHQRLAEEQRRLASVERRAKTLEQHLKSARGELHQRYAFDQIIGRSPVLRDALTRAAQVARTDTTVLITGESGTGKELVARAIHYESARSDGPFVAVNCAALPDALLESELFGHERGAFTGADRQKPGRFELAAHGTLFLDEIGELSPSVQVKLLRVLQEREFQRLGGTATIKADVRLVAATNRDLATEIAAGRFRADLFYRLSVFNVHLPPLRARGDDVLLLADAFIRTLAPRMGRADVTLSRDARDLLQRYPWPGNIREVQNAIERALITCEGTLVTAAHLAIPVTSDVAAPREARVPSEPPAAVGAADSSLALDALERKTIVDALRRTHGHKTRAAALLGLTRFQLYSRLKRYNIEVPPD